jgi:hypothetical protein
MIKGSGSEMSLGFEYVSIHITTVHLGVLITIHDCKCIAETIIVESAKPSVNSDLR